MIDLDVLSGILLPAAASGLVTWGVVRTELRWLRADVDRAHQRIDALDASVPAHRHRRREDPVDA